MSFVLFEIISTPILYWGYINLFYLVIVSTDTVLRKFKVSILQPILSTFCLKFWPLSCVWGQQLCVDNNFVIIYDVLHLFIILYIAELLNCVYLPIIYVLFFLTKVLTSSVRLDISTDMHGKLNCSVVVSVCSFVICLLVKLWSTVFVLNFQFHNFLGSSMPSLYSTFQPISCIWVGWFESQVISICYRVCFFNSLVIL